VVTRNVTLALPAELVRRARVCAAQQETSLSALVASYLETLTRPDKDYQDVWQRERALMREGLDMRVGEITWTRADTHVR